MKRRSKAGGNLVKARRRKGATRRGHARLRRRSPPGGQKSDIARFERERDEALEQQAATSEVLKLISRATFDLQSVLDKVAKSAARLCDAEMAGITREHEGAYYYASVHNYPAELHEFMRNARHERSRGSVTGRALLEGKTVHVRDVTRDPEYTMRDFAQKVGIRTALGVPLLRDGVAIGVIVLARRRVRPFRDREIALVRSFADQAVIAIENARLLNELRERTADLTESLDQQTATSEVLSVISKTPGALEPVFSAMLEKAVRICQAGFGNLWLREGDCFRIAATYGAPRKYLEHLSREPVVRPSPGIALDRIVKTKQVYQIADVSVAPTFDDKLRIATIELAGARTLIGVPMLKDDEVIGVVAIYRQEVRPFTDKQIALVQNFANQAVIAIENTRLLNELRQRTEDLTESLEQQTGTSEVLKVISSSPGDLQPVFEAMLSNAVRICSARFGNLFLFDGHDARIAAMHNAPSAYEEQRRGNPIIPLDGTIVGPAVRTKRVNHVNDLATDKSYAQSALVRLAGARSGLAVPMLRDETVIGGITIYRDIVQPFTNKQIALLQNFAAQAVIAIENARLLNELRESLDRQTATAEVLQVINSSAGSLTPVFKAMLDKAMQLCEAAFGGIWTLEGDRYTAVALQGVPESYAAFLARTTLVPGPGTAPYRLMQGEPFVHNVDLKSEEPYQRGDAQRRALVDLGGARTALQAALRKDDAVLGIITIYRQEVRPYTDKQIELLQNFADQAVIAIENTRLLNELRQSLDQQTATAEVLRVISNSPTNVQPVFDSIAESAVRLCDGQFSFVVRFDGKLMRFASSFGLSAEGLQVFRRMMPMPAREDTAVGRAILRRAVVEVPDVEADHAYGTQAQDLARANTYRSIAAVPLLHEGHPTGAIAVARADAGSFPERQIALLQAFADQAVIAIRNVGLFDEVQARTEELSESLQQQTATADVLKVISRSTFDLQTVLDTLVQSAARLCDAESASIHRPQGISYPYVASYGLSKAYDEYMRKHPLVPDRGTVLGRAVTECRPIQVNDVEADPEYTLKEGQKLAGFRTVVGIPLLREGVPIGIIMLTRKTVRPFTDKQIELATTFADQAAIAIENVRLFDEIQDKSRQLEEASKHKSQFLANMSHELRTPLNAILGYTELMADGAYGVPSEKMSAVLKRLESNGRHLLGLINDVLDLSKIEAGQLVLDLNDYSLQGVTQTVHSAVEPLAADKKLTFKVEVAPDLPSGRGDERRLTQVLLNLVGNAIKFTDSGEVSISVGVSDGAFKVAVRDTGPGISAADQAKLFQEFQQADNSITRKKGGTGLGLAISKRIIEMHGGKIWIDSTIGRGSIFSFTVPVRVDHQVEAA